MKPRLEKPTSITHYTGGSRRYPTIGSLRLGIKPAGNGFPKDVHHFVLDNDPAGNAVRKVYGNEPTRLKCVFPSDDILDHYDRAYRVWGGGFDGKGGRLKCESYDGIQALQKDDAGVAKFRPCPWQYADDGRTIPLDASCDMMQDCKQQLRLSVQLIDVSVAGLYKLYTGSVVGMDDLVQDIQHVLDLQAWVRDASGGEITRLPFWLCREERQIAYTDPKTGKEKISTHWPLRIRLDEEVDEKIRVMYAAALVTGGTAKPVPERAIEAPATAARQIEGPSEPVEAEVVASKPAKFPPVKEVFDAFQSYRKEKKLPQAVAMTAFLEYLKNAYDYVPDVIDGDLFKNIPTEIVERIATDIVECRAMEIYPWEVDPDGGE